jgi:DNA repair protein SbcC/Rad50
LTAAQTANDELSQLAAVLPLLVRFAQARDDLRIARERERRAAEQEHSIKIRGEQLTADLTALAPQIEARTAEKQRADDAASAAKALRQQAVDEERAFRELEGEKLCRQCGQELTPAHFDAELAKRQTEVNDADAKTRAALTAQRAAQLAEANIRQQASEMEKERQAKREEYLDLHRQLEQARADAERHARDCAAVYRDLPQEFRTRIAVVAPADWLSTSEPTRAELDAARAKLSGLDAARVRLREVQQQHVAWTTVRGQVQTSRQGVGALVGELPGEPDELRRTFTRTEAEGKALQSTLKAARAEALVVQNELDRLAAERQAVEAEFSAASAQLQAQEVTQKLSRQSVDAALALLPESWRTQAARVGLTELHGWKTERDALTAHGVEQKARDLQQTRAGFEALHASKADLDRELDAFPAEARRPLSEVQESLNNARQRGTVCEETLRLARHEKALLDDRRKRRADLHAETLQVERDHNRYEMLADLLSRERLQLHLVRQAERQIVDHANAVLDRLSGGQLYLRLRAGEPGQESDKALELEAFNRTTGGTAINVSFLSGSQRFRVAVSLALGIGQYASRRHRPIESVIIDEGFGCLDRNGRQVMIQELQNLRGHLRCILLVSHQEEFAEAFSDGYRFELSDGTTRVTRFSK